MEEQRTGYDRDRNYGRNRNRHSRHGGQNNHSGGRHRAQRPLLTSAINAAGLSLVALVFASLHMMDRPSVVQSLGLAVVLFGLSSFVSYFAQRLKPAIIEKISDVLFLIGVLVILWVSIDLSGLLAL
jgi:hypothetical protein